MTKTITQIELKNLIHSGQALAFVGSGLSSHVYDSWADLICNLCESCDIDRPFKNKKRDSLHLMRKADKCREHSPQAYREYLVSHFGPPPVYRRRAYELLATMPFAGYVTINFDPMLETEIRRVRKDKLQLDVYKDLNILKINNEKMTLFYLHGKIDPQKPESADTLVLGLEEFEAAYARRELTGPVAGFLQQLLTHQRVVFFGCGLDEPLMNQVMKSVQSVRREIGKDGTHYALLPMRQKIDECGRRGRDVESEREEESSLQDCGIIVVRYDHKDRFHSPVENILSDLAEPPSANDMPGLENESLGGILI